MSSAPSTHPSAGLYRASGFSNRIGWGQKPALVLIDVCLAYFTPDSPLSLTSNPAAAACPASMKRLLTAARASNIPVIWTQVYYSSPTLADAGLFHLKAPVISVWQKGDTRGLEKCLPGLEPLEGEEVILKKHPSAFFGTELAGMLRFMGVDTLVIGGVSTSGCVRATALDAMCHNFRTMVVGSACGDRSPEIHGANIFDMDAKFADVVEEDEAIEHLKAGWPKV